MDQAVLNSVVVKPGTMLAMTPTGGTLLDLLDDRYIALTPVSAAIWSELSQGACLESLLRRVTEQKGISRAAAKALLVRQLSCWERAGLIDAVGWRSDDLPTPVTRAGLHPSEVNRDAIAGYPLSVSLLVQLWRTERQYRRALRKLGLAATLARLQHEGEPRREPDETEILRTLRSYYALRRAYKQGHSSRDCLPRSLALSAIFRRCGFTADLCIGVIDMPFSAHAWVEGHGFVLNETLAHQKKYTVIARF